LDDLIEYIKLFDYWIINKIPNEFYNWIFQNKNKINIDLLNELFPMNDLIKQIHIIINISNNYLCENACIYGFLNLLKYAHKNGCPWNKNIICCDAVFNGHLECLKYLYENGCILDELTCSTSVINGHLECLKFLHKNGCSWDELTCSNAAEYGHINCLKFARENGCPWIAKLTCSNAARNKHIDCLNYVLENGYVWDNIICDNVKCDEDLERLRNEEHNINV
jgi:hypothetical protein